MTICSVCGTKLWFRANTGADIFEWRDAYDRTWADEPGYLERHAEHVALAARFHKNPKSLDPFEVTQLANANVWADTRFGAGWHYHNEVPEPDEKTLAELWGAAPDCCGWPARMVPSGWRCRQSRKLVNR